ncbi:MAG: MFS transporter [Acidimicrobiia bacterium]|nr:MFS transporter [Acidimicrobiia bacterium]
MAVPAGRSTTAIGWRAVITGLATDTVAILPGFMTAGMAVQIRADIGMSLTGLGVALGVFFGSAAVASAPMGALAERWGWPRSLRIAALAAGASLAATGWLAQSAAGLIAIFAAGGVAVALGHPAANLAVARCVPAHRHGLFYGLKHAAVPASTLLGGLAVPAIALTVGWRWAFLGGALLALATALAVPTRRYQFVSDQVVSPRRHERPRPSTELRLLVILSIAVGLGIGGIDALASFIVSYSVDIGIEEGTAGLLLAAGSVIGISVRVVAGWMIDRKRESDLFAVAVMLVVGSGGVIVLNLGGTVGLLVGGLIAFAAGWGWSGLFTFAVVKDNPNAPAAATGVTQVGKLVGAALGPAAFGWLADSVDYATAWWTITGTLLVASGLLLYVRNRRTAGTIQPVLLHPPVEGTS